MATAFLATQNIVAPEISPGEAFEAGHIFNFNDAVRVGKSVVQIELLVPENRIYDGIGVWTPGFGGIEGSSVAPSEAHAQEGLIMARFSPARKSDKSFCYDITHGQELHIETLKAVFGAISGARFQIKKQVPGGVSIDFDKHALYAHSMGGLSATGFALQEPGSTDFIFHKASCGLDGPKLPALAKDVPLGALAGLWHDLIPAFRSDRLPPSRRNARQIIDYLTHLHLIAEAVSCITDNVAESTQQLKERGIYVDYEGYQFDILVRPSALVADYVNSHRTMRGAGHMAPIGKAQAVARGSAQTILDRQAA